MRFVPWAGLALVAASSVGCNADDAPLGGPYGGSASAPPPPGPGNFESSGVEGGIFPIFDGGVDGVAPDGAGDEVAALPTDAGDAGTQGGAPTWATIFTAYLPMCKTCHVEMSSAESSYAWLVSQGFIDGAFSPLVSSAQSCLTWYGGDMPPGGTSNAAAVAAMDAWAAAGALGPAASDN